MVRVFHVGAAPQHCRGRNRQGLLATIFFMAIAWSVPSPANTLSPIEGVVGVSGLPFCAAYNASLCMYQTGTPLGVQIGYKNDAGRLALMTGLSRGFGASGFGLVFQRRDGLPYFIPGFCQKIGHASIGGSVHLLVDTKAAMSGDVNVAYRFEAPWTISLGVQNLFTYNAVRFQPVPAAHVSAGVDLSSDKRLVANTGAHVNLRAISDSTFGYGLAISIEKAFFKNPMISAYLGLKGARESTAELTGLVTGGLGWHAHVRQAYLGISAGYGHDFVGRQSGPYCSVVINPSAGRDETAPQLRLAVSDSIIDRSNPSAAARLVAGLWCRDEPGGSGVEKWELVIQAGTEDRSETVKKFTGGGMPPSSIVWDARDMSGEYVYNRTVFMQFRVTDKKGNASKTDWIKVTIRN